MPSAHISLTPDEIISTINHSSLPTAVCEGDDDVIVLRRLEEVHSDLPVSILPVGGRTAVLAVYDRKAEISPEKKVVFIADRDLWVLADMPAEYAGGTMLFTTGYSIENDVFCDGDLGGLMSMVERQRFDRELRIVIEHFSLAACRVLSGREGNLSLHPNALLDDANCRAQALTLDAEEVYPHDLRERITNDYATLLRGKSLMALLMRHLSYSGRIPRHNHRALIELVATKRGPRLDALFDKVGIVFAEP